jgi:CBS domain-containing protein
MTYLLVRNVMTPEVVTVAPDTPYQTVVDTLVDAKVSGAPVVDGAGRVVGVITEADLLRREARASVAADLMTAPAVMVGPQVSAATAIGILAQKRIKRLPVVDENGRLMGVVSRRDLLRRRRRPDSAIHVDVVEEVLGKDLWIGPNAVQVAVTDGVVMLLGKVDRRSLADRAVELTRDVAGVVDVVSRLRWEFDDAELVGRT